MNSHFLEEVFRDIKDVVSNKAQAKSRNKKPKKGEAVEDSTTQENHPKKKTNKNVTGTQGSTLGDWSNEFADSYRHIFGKNLLISKETKPTEAKFITHPFTPPTHNKIESLLMKSKVLQGADNDDFRDVITKKIHDSFGETPLLHK